MRPALRLAALAAAGALASAGTAWACSCSRASSAAEQLGGADLAFKGQALSETMGRSGFAATTRFRVTEVIKGKASREIRVDHPLGDAGCGVRFKRGATVLVLAHRRPDGRWSTSLCSRPQFPEAEFRRAARGLPTPVRPPEF